DLPPPRDVAEAQAMLAAIGYRIGASGALDEQARLVLTAFQRRFRPRRIDGALDGETGGRLAAVAREVAALRAGRD
ncbi:MAG: peptidoglycan-binding protein, partial [Acidobacteriota bacterium]